VTCYYCGGAGHTAAVCASKPGEGSSSKNNTMKSMDMLDQSRKVVGRIHEPWAVRYWIEVIKPPPVVVCWLRNYVPLFPREVWSLIQNEVPRPYDLAKDQEVWLEREILRLEKLGAIVKVGITGSRPTKLEETKAGLKALSRVNWTMARKLASVTGK
ncbi:6490_t:CDS:2, partial [Racocetra persica]